MKNKIWPLLLSSRCILFLAVFVIAHFATKKPFENLSRIWSVTASIINIVTIVLLVMLSRKSGGYKKLINYEKGKTRPKQVVMMTLLILLVGIGGMYLAGFICYGVIPYTSPMMIEPISLPLAILNFFFLPVSTALAEDGLYLGYGVNVMKNKAAAIVVPAFFFALQHCFIPTLFDWKYIFYRFLSFLPLTVILCVYYRKNRNPVPVMVGHAVIDLVTVSWILASSMIPGFYETMLQLANG